MDSYFTPYPTHIEICDDYWVCSHDIKYVYVEEENGYSS